MSRRPSLKHVFALGLAGLLGGPAYAGELQPLAEIPTVSGDLLNFCAPYGDFIACSTAVLNFVTNGGVNESGLITVPNTNQVNGAFHIRADQGFLSRDDVIVVYGGSGAVIENPTYGTSLLDDAFTNSAGRRAGEFSTVGDYWDIGLDALLAGLTDAAGALRDPVFVFDNNQVGEDANASIRLWGLLALRDLQGLMPDLVFEFTNNGVVAPDAFASTKVLGDDPLSNEFVLVQGEYCVDANFAEVACDGNQTVRFNQNRGTNVAEFFGFLPELTGSKLRQYMNAGYDVLSLDLAFFGQSGGFDDLFILAMATSTATTSTVPEPGTLALVGLGGLGFALRQRRRRA